jgi:L-asparaginase II
VIKAVTLGGMDLNSPVLVEVERSGFVESRHRGIAVALNADGTEAVRLGDPEKPIFPRSTVKPFQAVALVRAGLPLEGELLALAAASHSGEKYHVTGVEKILLDAGLTADALQCPIDWPMDAAAERNVVRAGGGPSRLLMNCSGKHAAMLATCVLNAWPTETYLDAGHSLQRLVREVIEEAAGERVATVGTDGCGSPLFAISPLGLARAFRGLLRAAEGTAEHKVAAAMRAHPKWTSGTRREEKKLMHGVPGLLIKCGAEGVDAFALDDGRAGVVKIEDGAMRARTPVTVALLRALGVTDAPVLDELATTDLMGGPAVVGQIRLAWNQGDG